MQGEGREGRDKGAALGRTDRRFWLINGQREPPKRS